VPRRRVISVFDAVRDGSSWKRGRELKPRVSDEKRRKPASSLVSRQSPSRRFESCSAHRLTHCYCSLRPTRSSRRVHAASTAYDPVRSDSPHGRARRELPQYALIGIADVLTCRHQLHRKWPPVVLRNVHV
jgi:hypothetical protein